MFDATMRHRDKNPPETEFREESHHHLAGSIDHTALTIYHTAN